MDERRQDACAQRCARIIKGLSPYRHRLMGMLVGLVMAILFMTLGFWRTLLIIFLVGTGYALGSWMDGSRILRYLVKRYLKIG